MKEIEVIFNLENAESVLRAEGHNELEVISHFVSTVSPGDIVWDIGANQGTYTLFASKIGAETHAFEPNPSLQDIMRKNLEVNRLDARIHGIGLGDSDSTKYLQRSGHAGGDYVSDESGNLPIEIRRGDSLDIKAPTVVKIDVEGYEEKVLDGMADSLHNCHTCFVECHNNRDNITETLKDYGYTIQYLESGVLKGSR